ncbi:MAG: adenylate/guanylate cyclase domain-containing protein, partial [Myxococcales bacterium]
LEPCPDNAYRSLYPVVLASAGLLSSPHKCGACGWHLSLQARFCERCGEPTGRNGAPRADRSTATRRPLPVPLMTAPVWSEERKLATVLFADLAGFTSISSRLEPDAVREFANECFEPLTQEIARRGGTVLKYIGDCVMAAFGVPIGAEDDARRAVAAAVAMFRRLGELSPRIEAKYGAPINMRIGINTGLVMVGSVGSGPHAALDIMGTAVNMASRVQSVAQPGEVVLGQATQRLVQRQFDLEALGPTELKGIPEPVPIFRVIGEKPEELQSLPATDLSLEASFNLREREMAVLRGGWEWVVSHRKLKAVRLIGDAGLGKSRMLFHLRALLANDARKPHLLTAAGVAGATGHVTPLSVLGRLVRGRFGVRPDEPPDVARARVVEGVGRAFPEDRQEDAAECAGLIADVAALHVSSDGAPVPLGEGAFNRDRILRACAEWIRTLAAERPVCLLLQDLQWADDASLEFLERLLRALQDAAVFFLSAERPDLEDRRPSWALVTDVSDRVDLGPIGLERMRQFVDHILPEVPGFPDELKEKLVQKSEGNPECARELIRLLIDRGAIVVGTTTSPWQFRADRLGEIELP